MTVIPAVGVIEPQAATEAPLRGVFGPGVDDTTAVALTGADALAWWPDAAACDDLVFGLWIHPDQPVILYTGREGSLIERLRAGTLVLLSGGGLDADPSVAWSRAEVPDGVEAALGARVLCSFDSPSEAAARIAGPPDRAGSLVATLGASATIIAQPGSALSARLRQAGVVPSRCLSVRGPASAVTAPLAWTHSLGTLQLRSVDTLDGSDPGWPVVVGADRAPQRAADLLRGPPDEFEVVVAADAGGLTSPATDLVTALTAVGPVAIADGTKLERALVVLRGPAAQAVRDHVDAPAVDGPVFGAAAGEDPERYEAHQWAGSILRAEEAREDDWPVGGPTLTSEADAVGLVAADATNTDGAMLDYVARARGWQVIDPALPPVLEAVLAHARRQVAGDDTPMPAELLAQVTAWGAEPGFWSNLVSSTEPPSDDRVVFPFPAPAVEILRAVVAASGDAARLRDWLGPVKVAVLRELYGGGPDG